MVHFIVTADTGSGYTDQYKVANSMTQLIKKYPINSVLLLGDNIYEEGVKSVDDPQFKEKFEDPYQNVKKPFYLCLGNHDYGNSFLVTNNQDHQVEYSKISKKWNMPSKYYSIQKGPCEFFFLDTNFEYLNESSIMKQFHIMSQKIKQSKKKWKIVCGHHPWRSVGGHGNADKRLETFMNDLCAVPGLTFDLYMCGHDHCKNYIVKTNPYKKKDIALLVIGTGGKQYDEKLLELTNMKEGDSKLLFHSPNLGVCHIEATKTKLKLTCYNELLQEEFNITLP
tara:strand:+ start:255 stop:1097 length:843 start_codon:yes stop_codon:yes gene_type:complete